MSYEQAKSYSEENEAAYFETSARNGANVEHLFGELGMLILQTAQKNESGGLRESRGFELVSISENKQERCSGDCR